MDCNPQFTDSINADGSCNCKESFSGATCDEKIKYELECDQSFVNVKVKMSAFESVGITQADQLFLNDPACHGVQVKISQVYIGSTFNLMIVWDIKMNTVIFESTCRIEIFAEFHGHMWPFFKLFLMPVCSLDTT